jgi:serine phosphatase RsbU (regulator of sigma subunit)
LILLKDEHTMEFTGRVAQTREGTRLERMDVPRTIIGEVVRTRTSLLTADAMGDARFRGGESVHNLRVRSMICVPLLFENELVGVLYVDTTRPGRPFVAEDLELLTGIGAQAALAVQNAMMHERLLHRQRVESDLQFAHEVQKGFLPETPPRIPGYEFASWYSAARVVGGDFYDFIELPDDRLAIVVGDVSGKGVSAALLMAKLMSEVRYVALTEAKPTEVLRRLNEDFGRRPMEGRFVTMLYVVLDPNARRIEAVNAGHPAGLIRRRREGAIEKIEGGVNYPLGIESDTAFTSVVCELDKGDAVALFTDGVTDAMDAKGQAYGDPRLEELVRSGPEPPEQLMARILDDIGSHVGNVPPTDDLTLVCFGPTTATKK